MIANPTVCPTCGTRLSSDALEGLCASCLLREGFAGGDETASQTPAQRRQGLTAAGREFGDYELLEEIARGGMGVVYRARQRSLKRIVALKMILSGHLATEAEVQRFRTEAEAAAKLDHPNIVPIYEVGEVEGRHYFTMKFVEGGNLAGRMSKDECRRTEASRVGETQFDIRPSAFVISKVSRAVHYAHQRGILHRDLKPTNILLDERGEPQLTDFGLAKLVERDAGLTQSVSVMGTAAYMSPEQARGVTREVTTATDIYSLGAILFELLTGRPPFVGEDFVSTLRKVVEDEPPSLRAARPDIDRDLETICLKCLEKDPARRYGAAGQLADDLERWLRREPIHARASTTWERVVKAARRRPAVAALSGAICLAVMAGVAGVVWQWQRAEGNARESRSRLVHSFVANGVKRINDGDLFGALPWLIEAYRLEQNSPVQADLHRLRLAATLRPCPKLVHVFFHESPLNEAIFSPDGKLIASATSAGVVRVFKADTGEPAFAPLEHGRQVRTIQFSPDNSMLVTLTGEPGVSQWALGIAEIWDAGTGRSLGRFGLEGESVEAVQFSPDSRHLATASGDLKTFAAGTAVVWDIGAQKVVTKPMRHRNRIPSLQFTRDGTALMTASFDGVARIWDARTGEPLSPPLRHNHGLVAASFDSTGERVVAATHGGYAQMWKTNGEAVGPPLEQGRVIYGAAFSAEGSRVLTMGYDGTARIWNAFSGLPACAPLKHELLVWRAAFSADATRVATASFDNTARVWDAMTGEPLTPPLNHAGFVMTANFSPDGYYLLTASRDRTVRLWAWDRKNGDALRLRHDASVVHAEFSPDGRRILTASEDNFASIWDAATGERVLEMEHLKKVNSAAFSPDGKLVATGSSDFSARVWNAVDGAPVTPPLLHSNSIRTVAFSGDSRRVVTASSDGTAQVWNALTGQSIGGALIHSNVVRDAQFSPDGRRVATASDDGTARVWDADTGAPVTPSLPHPSTVYKVAFSPDGKRIVTSCYDRTFDELAAYVWDVASARQATPPLQHKDGVSFAQFSPDGKRIVTAGEDQCARVWDAAAGATVTPALLHKHHVTMAVFSPDGRKIATAGFDGSARIWDAETGEPLTPFLPHGNSLASVAFSPDSQRIVTASADGAARIWNLSTNDSSIAEMSLLAELLSGKRVGVGGGLTDVDTASLSNTWTMLRAARPAAFATSAAERASWHETEMDRNDRVGFPFAVTFHRHWLEKSNDARRPATAN